MRSVHLQDLLAAARVVIAAAAAEREALCRELMRRAERADRLARGAGPGAARQGDGTLADAARGYPAAPFLDLDDAAHCACLEMVLRHLRTRPRSALL